MLDTQNLNLFIAVPLKPECGCLSPFRNPESFHIVKIDYETADCISNSPFSKLASESTDIYPIELFEDPYFDPEDIETLAKCLTKWRNNLRVEDKSAFELVESLLNEAKERKVGIYFKF